MSKRSQGAHMKTGWVDGMWGGLWSGMVGSDTYAPE